jgi:hypothetical protein
VAAIRRGTATCVAILVDVNQRDGVPGHGPIMIATETLRTAGWRVLTISTAGALATAWAHAGEALEDARYSPPAERSRP